MHIYNHLEARAYSVAKLTHLHIIQCVYIPLLVDDVGVATNILLVDTL